MKVAPHRRLSSNLYNKMRAILSTKLGNLKGVSQRNMIIAGGVAVALLATGFLLLKIGASGFVAALDPDQGALSGNAQVVTDASASGGKAVQFTAPPSAPPPPPPPTLTTYPNAFNTGVPVGITLTPYTGPCTITSANTVIDSKLVD